MKKQLVLLIAALGFLQLSPAYASSLTLSDLNFDNLVDSGEMIFIPLKETSRNRGVLWYRHYAENVSPPSGGTWDMRKITVFLNPVSTSQEVNDFLRSMSASDARSYVLPEDAVLCEPTPQLDAFMRSLNIPYEYLKKGPRYPGICGLDIRYTASTDIEAQIVDFVNTHPVARVKFTVVQPNPEPIVIQVPEIIQLLQNEEVIDLKMDGNGYRGQAEKIVFYSSRIDATLYGYEFGSELEFDRWQYFYSLFEASLEGYDEITLDKASVNFEVEQTLENPITFGIIVN